MTTTIPTTAEAVPVGPGLSMFDPIFIGIDEFGQPVYLDVVYRNLLTAGEPGGGKSGLINNICGHAALCDSTRLVLFDAKLVELGPWRDLADAFIGPDIDQGIEVLRRLLVVATNRYAWLLANRRRKLAEGDGMSVIVTIIDELAMFSTVLGTKQQQEEFSTLLRGLVSLGRACGMPVVAATQRPSWDIIPASLRDLFGYRAAFRCTSLNSSNIILGQGWAEQGYTASDISPTNQGAAYLLAEGGVPRRIKAAYLTDTDIYNIADYAAWTRRPTGTSTPAVNPTEWDMAA
ncbi:FtsK/SpoIIIE domain-containing protein [Micromonospora chokoriensis]|uniref:DNA segregation ATPase FtsK/SpoIIIE, S-DNA-T family n=1 Tax=Micromonospora chokoriensis TaxID=356851 RepID=A0A1C4UP50_9ACTN|nr:FtsK/SpoIIIE domain-containing protein [Micromonospora chokoriensis]SCE73437.1 DNA segregation ATPase FtsK/SpoIIIE, S-DNA-T family [Micromonospora chokoriensis]